MALAGCNRAGSERDEGPRVIELMHDTIHLEAGVRLHGIQVRREAAGEFHPDRTEARVGDYVRFTADDMAGHAIAFSGSSLDPAVLAFLEQTGQLRGPPLIARESSWVITLENAPPGRYPFHCTTHDVHGLLTVQPRDGS